MFSREASAAIFRTTLISHTRYVEIVVYSCTARAFVSCELLLLLAALVLLLLLLMLLLLMLMLLPL